MARPVLGKDELQAVVAGQIFKVPGHAAPGQIVWRGEDAHRGVFQLVGDQARVAERTQADGQVEALVHKIHQPVGDAQLRSICG